MAKRQKRRQRGMNFEDELIDKVDKVVKKKFTTRTQYFTDAVVEKLEKDKELLKD